MCERVRSKCRTGTDTPHQCWTVGWLVADRERLHNHSAAPEPARPARTGSRASSTTALSVAENYFSITVSYRIVSNRIASHRTAPHTLDNGISVATLQTIRKLHLTLPHRQGRRPEPRLTYTSIHTLALPSSQVLASLPAVYRTTYGLDVLVSRLYSAASTHRVGLPTDHG